MSDPLTLIQGDALSSLQRLPDESVQTCVTSPPYWGLRDYGVERIVWDETVECDHEFVETRQYQDSPIRSGGEGVGFHDAETTKAQRWRTHGTCSICGAWRGCLGLEPTPELYVAHLVEIFREVKRVLRSDGTLWLNLGSSYAGSGKGGNPDNSEWKGFVGNSGREDQAKVRPVVMDSAYGTYALRDDLSPDDIAYVLSELSRFRQGREIGEPNLAIDVHATVTSLADGE